MKPLNSSNKPETGNVKPDNSQIAQTAGAEAAGGPSGMSPAAKKYQKNIQSFDAFEAVRLRQEFFGELSLSALARLVDGLPSSEGSVLWRARGDEDPLGQALLHVHVQAAPTVTCQRCLEPFQWPIDAVTVLHLVASDAELKDDEPLSEDEFESGYDKVVGSHHFDLQAEIENELILAMPYIPKHDVCPDSPRLADNEPAQSDRQQPFAGLAQLRDRLQKK